MQKGLPVCKATALSLNGSGMNQILNFLLGVLYLLTLLRGIARLEQHRHEVVPGVAVRVNLCPALGLHRAVLHAQSRQEIHKEGPVEILTHLVEYKPVRKSLQITQAQL